MTRSITAPTSLSGVEAPAVTPIRTSPVGSHDATVTSARVPGGRCRIEPSGCTQSEVATWYVGTRSAQMCARFAVRS